MWPEISRWIRNSKTIAVCNQTVRASAINIDCSVFRWYVYHAEFRIHIIVREFVMIAVCVDIIVFNAKKNSAWRKSLQYNSYLSILPIISLILMIPPVSNRLMCIGIFMVNMASSTGLTPKFRTVEVLKFNIVERFFLVRGWVRIQILLYFSNEIVISTKIVISIELQNLINYIIPEMYLTRWLAITGTRVSKQYHIEIGHTYVIFEIYEWQSYNNILGFRLFITQDVQQFLFVACNYRDIDILSGFIIFFWNTWKYNVMW